MIYSAGNGVAEVDDEWFAYAVDDEVLGLPVKLCPPEETLWSKGFIMERERFDGADVAHLLRARAESLDWPRLLRRFGPYWRVLLAHLTLFGFIYPGERHKIPRRVMEELGGRLLAEAAAPAARGSADGQICLGTILSREQYLPDVQSWGYRDGRLVNGHMSQAEAAIWTEAIETSKGGH